MSTSSAPGFSVRVILSLAALAIIFGVTFTAVRNHQPASVDSDVAQQRLDNKATAQLVYEPMTWILPLTEDFASHRSQKLHVHISTLE